MSLVRKQEVKKKNTLKKRGKGGYRNRQKEREEGRKGRMKKKINKKWCQLENGK